jgi:hypothetical protein
LYIPGFGDVSTPSALAATLSGTSASPRMPYESVSQTPLSRMQTRDARAGILGPLANPLQGQGVAALTRPTEPREGSTGQQVTDTGEGGDTGARGFNPYGTALPPLSPQMLAAIEQRRAASLRQLQEAEAQAASQRQQAELANVGRLLGIEEETGRARREGMTELASRGVARSPLFANPFRRELARQQQQQIGESQQQLASTLDQLQLALEGARQRRESELAQIAFETAQQRSSVPRLLGLE